MQRFTLQTVLGLAAQIGQMVFAGTVGNLRLFAHLPTRCQGADNDALGICELRLRRSLDGGRTDGSRMLQLLTQDG